MGRCAALCCPFLSPRTPASPRYSGARSSSAPKLVNVRCSPSSVTTCAWTGCQIGTYRQYGPAPGTEVTISQVQHPVGVWPWTRGECRFNACCVWGMEKNTERQVKYTVPRALSCFCFCFCNQGRVPSTYSIRVQLSRGQYDETRHNTAHLRITSHRRAGRVCLGRGQTWARGSPRKLRDSNRRNVGGGREVETK